MYLSNSTSTLKGCVFIRPSSQELKRHISCGQIGFGVDSPFNADPDPGLLPRDDYHLFTKVENRLVS